MELSAADVILFVWYLQTSLSRVQIVFCFIFVTTSVNRLGNFFDLGGFLYSLWIAFGKVASKFSKILTFFEMAALFDTRDTVT